MNPLDFLRQGPADGGNFEQRWSHMYLAAYVISDIGKRRERNEDSAVLGGPSDIELLDGCGYLFAVADGMGGASAGEHASHLALETFSRTFYDGPAENLPERMRHSIESANRAVFDESESKSEYHGMGTTLTAVSIIGDCAYVGQVGDSRVYLQRADNQLLQVTQDHSLVAEQVRGGLLSEEQARNHAMKNLITRAVGIRNEVEADVFGVRLAKGDTLMLCSDGLCNFVPDQDIAGCLQLKSLESSARVLVGKALEAGGTDNISSIVVRLLDSPPRKPMQEGCEPVETPSLGLWTRVGRLFG
jgi:protein phosphatase